MVMIQRSVMCPLHDCHRLACSKRLCSSCSLSEAQIVQACNRHMHHVTAVLYCQSHHHRCAQEGWLCCYH